METDARRGGASRVRGSGVGRRTALVLSWAALLGFFGRSIIDFRYVYPDQILDTASNAIALVAYVAILGGWVAALIALAGHHRWGGVACLAFALLPILLGVTTEAAFCPTPCATAPPLADITNWVCLGLGVLSAVSLIAYLRSGDEGRLLGSAPTGD